MRIQSRRQFIGHLLVASVGCTTLSRTAGAASGQSADGLVELCVTAREPGTLPNAVVDVWTGQIGVLDLSQLPERFGRVVVWDDVRGNRALLGEIAGILSAIEEYFGIKADLGSNASAHLGHSSRLSLSIDKLLHTFKPGRNDAVGRRIAVIDLSSCGLTGLRWLDIMPSLRRYYTHIIGVDFSVSDLCEPDSASEPPNSLSGLARTALQACDYWFLARDEPAQASIEERSFEFTKSINDLCDCVASANDIDTAIGSIAKYQFAVRGSRGSECRSSASSADLRVQIGHSTTGRPGRTHISTCPVDASGESRDT
jgi:hypothetical protein